MPFASPLEVRIYTDATKTTLVDELANEYDMLKFSTQMPGGLFKLLDLKVTKELSLDWLYLVRENLPGRHFHHVEVRDPVGVVWEGRLMSAGIEGGEGLLQLSLSAAGYWSAMRDRMYSDDDGGATDWSTGGSHDLFDIVSEVIEDAAPDISTDFSNMSSATGTTMNIDLSARSYPQDIISRQLPMVDSSGSVVDFWIDLNRLPYMRVRDTTILGCILPITEVTRFALVQDAYQMRNRIIPVVDGAEQTVADDTDSQSLYPRRDITVTLQTGISTAALNDERDAILARTKSPHQSQSFTVKGHVTEITDRLETTQGSKHHHLPVWRVMAGCVLRVEGLVPTTVTATATDNLATFFVRETEYNAATNTVKVTPDSRPSRLTGTILRADRVESP